MPASGGDELNVLWIAAMVVGMATLDPVQPHIEHFVREKLTLHPSPFAFRARRIRGGLVSPLVQHVSVHYPDAKGRLLQTSFVVKELHGDSLREAHVYEALSPHTRGFAPRLLAVHAGSAGTFLYLEFVPSRRAWPWRDLSLAARVLDKLALLHGSVVNPQGFTGWDYERELRAVASATLTEALRLARATGDSLVRRVLPALRRLVEHLPAIRKQLLDFGPLPATWIHGDVHPGNVVVRAGYRGGEPLLIDWARARWGSPLEDVSSWIEWLAFWEYAAMRKHDTLLTGYLRARGLPTPAAMSLRDAYWIAGAVNCLSGALLHHLGRAAQQPRNSQQRAASLRAVHHCLRIVRRADRSSFVASPR